jgi:competence protein ComGC
MDFVAELWRFMRARKKFWLLPMIVVFAIMGALLVITQGSALAPFIYTLF